MLLAAAGAILWRYVLASQADVPALMPGTAGTLTTKNSAGRSGAYFLPSGYVGRAPPLLVAIHGTNGSGEAMVRSFRETAVTAVGGADAGSRLSCRGSITSAPVRAFTAFIAEGVGARPPHLVSCCNGS